MQAGIRPTCTTPKTTLFGMQDPKVMQMVTPIG